MLFNALRSKNFYNTVISVDGPKNSFNTPSTPGSSLQARVGSPRTVSSPIMTKENGNLTRNLEIAENMMHQFRLGTVCIPGQKSIFLSENSHFENPNLHQIHITRISIFSKFTFVKSHFSLKFTFFEISFFTRFTLRKFPLSQNSLF